MKNNNASRSGQQIARRDSCACFSGRNSLLAIEPICWFCKYAAFDLKSDKLPEQGFCRYPIEQSRKEAKA